MTENFGASLFITLTIYTISQIYDEGPEGPSYFSFTVLEFNSLPLHWYFPPHENIYKYSFCDVPFVFTTKRLCSTNALDLFPPPRKTGSGGYVLCGHEKFVVLPFFLLLLAVMSPPTKWVTDKMVRAAHSATEQTPPRC